MKETSKIYAILTALFTLNNLAVPEIWADTKTKHSVLPTRSVRVTTGIEAVQGWEQGLVRGNPNLARWHWDPIYSYKQGYAKLPVQSAKPDTAVAPNQGYKHVPAGAVYPSTDAGKPVHIPFSSQALEEVRAQRISSPRPQIPITQANHKEQVSGQLVQHKNDPTIATYGQLYSRKENTSLKYNSQNTSVYGQLVNTKRNTGYNVAGVPKKHK